MSELIWTPLLPLIDEKGQAVPRAWEKTTMEELRQHLRCLMDMPKDQKVDLEFLLVTQVSHRLNDLEVLRTRTRTNPRMTNTRVSP